MGKICECSDKLEAKRVELEALIGRRAGVVSEFDGVVPESDPFREALSKVFHRKIKRSKKKGNQDDDYDSGDDDDDDDTGGRDGPAKPGAGSVCVQLLQMGCQYPGPTVSRA